MPIVVVAPRASYREDSTASREEIWILTCGAVMGKLEDLGPQAESQSCRRAHSGLLPINLGIPGE